MMKCLVTGAGGFIGGHLVRRLKDLGYYVRGVDVKIPEYRKTFADHFTTVDLRYYRNCQSVTKDVDYVFNLAADMGGIGYIGTVKAEIARNNVLINANMLEASRVQKVQRYFYSSSACVYPGYKQHEEHNDGLKEQDVMPADPEPGYGWEKLFAEKLCEYYAEDYGMEIRVARFHNVYGPYGTYKGGREKAPAAICRKIALAKNGDEITVWGDGKQTRSFLYIDDCVEGILSLFEGDDHGPFNIGSEELITIDYLVDLIMAISGKSLTKKYLLDKPQGVRGRTSDNTLVKGKLGWEPKVSLLEGLTQTYIWINNEVHCGK